MEHGEVSEVSFQRVTLARTPVRVQRSLAHLRQCHERENQLKTRMIPTYCGANAGCHLKTKLATSVSTSSLAVAVGGDVNVALLIDAAYEGFRFLRRSRVDVAQ
jgi:hypothetical protein